MVALTAPRTLVSATHSGAYTLVKIDDAGHLLRSDAAASVERMRASGLPRGNVTSAYRTAAEQRTETKRAAAGKTPSAAAIGTSWHEAALAVDWPEPQRSWVRAHGAEYGWVFTLTSEPWHAVYVPELDQHARQAPSAPIALTTEVDMRIVHNTTDDSYWAVTPLSMKRVLSWDTLAPLTALYGGIVPVDQAAFDRLKAQIVESITDTRKNLGL